MDYLDSLDLDTIDKKSHRVRSWYLYEQYKSLERSQLDAAQKLKDRSYQEKILRQELSERRARRKLYDQFGLCQSESRLKRSINSHESGKSSVSASNDDFFESFCDLQDDGLSQMVGTDLTEDRLSQPSSTTKCCVDDYRTTTEEHKDDNSCSGSITSVVENYNIVCDNDICQRAEDNLELSANTMADDIKMQLDSIQEDIQCLEEYAKMDDDDKVSEDERSVNTSYIEPSESKMICGKTEQEYSNLIAMWSRLVSFAYQVVQLNHGNCYCDYSSQFLTAVLACDVLRRGVSRMCNILQPYVSPIKYATDDSSDSISDHACNRCIKNEKRKKSAQLRKYWKICETKPLSTRKIKRTAKIKCTDRKYSENYCQNLIQHRTKPELKTCRRSSAPVQCGKYNKEDSTSSSDSSIWPAIFGEIKPPRKCCTCCHRAVNPMLKIAKYIDSLMLDLDDFKDL